MEIKELVLYNFRNFHYEKAKLSGGLNLILGKNGAGKTNFLEALSFIYSGKGFGDPASEVLMHNAEKGGVMAEFHEGVRDLRKVLYVEESGFKREMNNKPVGRISTFRTHNIVQFLPYDTLLIDGSPEIRRRFFDEIISTVSAEYEKNLRDYYKILKFRNNYLKTYSNPFKFLDAQDEMFVDLNKKIDEMRKKYVELILKRAKVHLYDIENSWNMNLSVENSWDINEPMKFRESVKNEDLRRRVTTWGVSKDDILIDFNGKYAKYTASRGQKRAIVIALKLASLDLYNKLSKKETILLLDDLLYEFDLKRDKSVADKIRGYRAFVTSTKEVDSDNVILIEKGKVIG